MSATAQSTVLRQPLRLTLESLYALNKHAKQLARAAQTDPRTTWLEQPSVDALRKDALYEVKRLVLRELQAEASRIELHEIRGTEFYCFYFGQWSFHTPADEYGATPDIDGRLQLPDFSTSHVAVRTRLSVTDALEHIADEFAINANAHLAQRHVRDETGGFVDVGWTVLEE